MKPMSRSYDKEKYIQQQKEKINEYQKIVADTLENYTENPELIEDYLSFAGKFHNYSFRNRMLIQKQNPNAVFVGGYEKFQELGYNVKQGEKGIKIFVPVTVTYFFNPETNEWNTIRQASQEEKNHIKNKDFETRQIQHFKLGTVFDISQTTCPPEDYPKLFDMGYASAEHKTVAFALEQYCRHYLNCRVLTKDVTSIALRGYFDPKSNSIVLSDKLNDSQRMCTLAHEMGHAIMHNDANMNSQKLTAQLEVEADAVSIMMTSALGIDKVQISETRKQHLAENFKSLSSLKENEDKTEILLEILENANDAFQQHIPDIFRTVQQTINYSQQPSVQYNSSFSPEYPTITFLWSDNEKVIPFSYHPFTIKEAENLLHQIDFEETISNEATRFKVEFGNDSRYDTKDITYMGTYQHGTNSLISHIAHHIDSELDAAQSKNDILQIDKLQVLTKDLWNAYDYNCIAELERKDSPNIDLIAKHYDNIEKREAFFQENGFAGKYIPKDCDKEKEKTIQIKR